MENKEIKGPFPQRENTFIKNIHARKHYTGSLVSLIHFAAKKILSPKPVTRLGAPN